MGKRFLGKKIHLGIALFPFLPNASLACQSFDKRERVKKRGEILFCAQTHEKNPAFPKMLDTKKKRSRFTFLSGGSLPFSETSGIFEENEFGKCLEIAFLPKKVRFSLS